jgi:putative ABC transport system permease protein
MFWRILGQLFSASRGRLAVALLALASGAAVTTALINLNLDAVRKVSSEFRTLGANVIAGPHAGGSAESQLMDESALVKLAPALASVHGVAAPYLYSIATVRAGMDHQAKETQVIIAGSWIDRASQLSPWWKISGQPISDRNDLDNCLVGRNVAQQLGIQPGSRIVLAYADSAGVRTALLTVAGVIDSGAQEDNQIIVNLPVVQKLSGLTDRIGIVQISVPGTPQEIESAISQLSSAVPAIEVRPVPQIAQAEASLLPRIRGLIFFMVALILVLTTLCVFASMAALAMERRRDVGLMKAIGGSISRIVRIFFTEAAALGLAGALIGYVAGIFLSRWIGQRAFHVAINARPEVFPIVVALMVLVSLAGALPLRLLGRVRPAEILRGE